MRFQVSGLVIRQLISRAFRQAHKPAVRRRQHNIVALANLTVDVVLQLYAPLFRVVTLQDLPAGLNVRTPVVQRLDLESRLAALCGGIFAVLRRCLERLLQQPFRRLCLLLCLARQLAHDLADRVAQLFKQRPVSAVPADKLIQNVRVGDHLARVVCRGLVHRLLHADLHAHAVVLLMQDLRRLRNIAVLHNGVSERRVLLGRKILHPVRPLMADDLHHGILRVLCNADLAALDDAVSRAAAHLVSHAHAHAERLCDGVDLVRRRAVHLAGNVFVVDKAAAALVFLRKGLFARCRLRVVLPCDIPRVGGLIRRVRVGLAVLARVVGG